MEEDDEEDICIDDEPTSSAEAVPNISQRSETSGGRRTSSGDAEETSPLTGSLPSAQCTQASAAAPHPGRVGEHAYSLTPMAEERFGSEGATFRVAPLVSYECQGGRLKQCIQEFMLQSGKRGLQCAAVIAAILQPRTVPSHGLTEFSRPRRACNDTSGVESVER